MPRRSKAKAQKRDWRWYASFALNGAVALSMVLGTVFLFTGGSLGSSAPIVPPTETFGPAPAVVPTATPPPAAPSVPAPSPTPQASLEGQPPITAGLILSVPAGALSGAVHTPA